MNHKCKCNSYSSNANVLIFNEQKKKMNHPKIFKKFNGKLVSKSSKPQFNYN